MKKFTDLLWEDIQSIYNDILKLSFITELQAGKLSNERFKRYIHQDSLYLADYKQALINAADKAPSTELKSLFNRFAQDSVDMEKIMHQVYFTSLNIDIDDREKSLECFAYTNFLIACTATNNFAVSVAAVLPCFWIYREVGHHIFANHQTANPYADWIAAYNAPAFDADVDRVLGIINELAEKADDDTKEKMRAAFKDASWMELLFWKSAYDYVK